MAALARTWMLVTNTRAQGIAIALAARIGAGTRGQALRHVEVSDGSAELRDSARHAARLAYEVLHRERYLSCQIVVDYTTGAAGVNVHGRSAELALALALAAAIRPQSGEVQGSPSVAATGALGDDGAVLPIERLREKVEVALGIRPPIAKVLFPAANALELPLELRRRAAAQGVALCPVKRLEEALRQVGLAIANTWLESPFRGLEPFEFEHASIYFGRAREVEDLLSLFDRRAARGANTLLVRGSSGSGKSSLVLAGFLPALLRRAGVGAIPRSGQPVFRWGLLRPRSVSADADAQRELAGLMAALQTCWRDAAGAALQPSAAGETGTTEPTALIAQWQSESGGPIRPVLILDQLEAWLRSPLHPQTLEALWRWLAQSLQAGFALLATLADTGHGLLRQHASLGAMFGPESEFRLEPLRQAEALQAVIREPAEVAKLRFEPGLEAEIFAAACQGGADVLPLLELLLTELYERRDPARNELRSSDYRAVGGLDGVVSARAQAAIASVPDQARASVSSLLWRLLTAESIVPADYPPAHPMHALLGALRERRLLVEDGGLERARLHPAHEALLRNWPRAVDFRTTHAPDIGLWLDLNRESRQWRRGERALIPAGPQLEAARALDERWRALWTAGDQPTLDYIRRSGRQANRRRVLTQIAFGVPASLAVLYGAKAGFDAVASRYWTRIEFEGVTVPPGVEIAADAYLHHHGIEVSARFPADSRLVIVDSLGLYDGQAIDSRSSGRVLTQQIAGTVAPISFTLTFPTLPVSVRLRRAALFPATGSGVTHPAWTAAALDAAGEPLASVAEPLLSAYRDVPAARFVLQDGRQRIRSLVVTSDYRDAHGRPFAGFHAVLLSEIELFHPPRGSWLS